MIQPDNSLMKWLGSGEGGEAGGGARGTSAPGRSQDDATVGYVFQRTPQDPEFPPFGPKHQRWALGDDTAIDNHDKWKYPPPPTINNSAPNPQLNQMNQIKSVTSQQNQLMMAAAHGGHATHMSSGLLPHHPGLVLSGHHHQQGLYDMHQQLQQQQQQMNGVGKGTEHLMYHLGQPGVLQPGPNPAQFMQQSQNQLGLNHIGGIRSPIAPAAKKLWDKTGGETKAAPPHLPPLQFNHEMWRDPTWSAQVEHAVSQPIAMGGRRGAYPTTDAGSTLSPRDATGGLGVKMVEYVLGGSPTGKDNHMSNLEPRLRALNLSSEGGSGENGNDNNKNVDGSEQVQHQQSGGQPMHNGNGGILVDDDKGFNRTPGSRQPSPADEEIHRNGNAVGNAVGNIGCVGEGAPFAPIMPTLPQHMTTIQAQPHPSMLSLSQLPHLQNLHSHAQHPQHHAQMHPGMAINDSMNQIDTLALQMEHHQSFENSNFGPSQQGYVAPPGGSGTQSLVNGGGVGHGVGVGVGVLPPQQQQLSDQQQQQHNFDVQQVLRSQQAAAAAAGGAGTPAAAAALQLQQFQQQQFQLQQQLAAQQAFPQPPYVINTAQEGTPYVSALIAAGVPPYYGVTATPWGVYPGMVPPTAHQAAAPPQQRRPLSPAQPQDQQVNGQGQFVIPYYGDPGSLVMSGRNGTPLRLVSPAPVLAGGAGRPFTAQPPTAPTAPQQTQLTGVSQSSGLFPGAFTPSLAHAGSPAAPLSGVGGSGRRDSLDRAVVAAGTVFSPGSLDQFGRGKWPGASTGSNIGTTGAPLSPTMGATTGTLPRVVSAAPGAEGAKYRNSLTQGLSTNGMFGSSSSILSKLSGTMIGGVPSTLVMNSSADKQPGRSSLLEDFRNNRYPNLQLRDLTNHIVEFSQDQHGSRFIQQKLERATAIDKQLVFNEILSAAYNLMTDVFGNYVIQKFFEFGTPEQKSTLASKLRGHVLALALQMYGCRVIQKALESIPPEQQQEVVRELDGHVLKCVKDQNGNHVVQKCIECVEPHALQFIINAFIGQVFSLSTHPYGCRVIQRILEHCTPEQVAPVLQELHTNTDQLIQDQYGNYVIQHVIEHGANEDKSLLISGIRGKVLPLSQHKFASNVVEKCVTHANRQERAFLIEEVCSFNDNALHVMMKDQYANYVVQKMIDVSEPTQRKVLMLKIRPHLNSLRKYTYGKHIIAKLEKFFTKTPTDLGPIGPPTNGVL